MPRGEKSKYSSKQKRKAEHIAKGYKKRGASARRAKAIGWATVNKESGGGEKSGSGRGRRSTKVSSRRGGKIGGRSVSARKRSAAGKKAAATRKRRASR
jgi:plasmid stabilization system protein ParE